MRGHRVRWPAIVLAAFALGVGACGDDDDTTAGDVASSLQQTASSLQQTASSLQQAGSSVLAALTELDGTWTLGPGVLDVEVAQDLRPTIVFDGTAVSGFTGCNQFNAVATIDGEALDLGPIAKTSQACPPAATAIEAAYLARLDQVARHRVAGVLLEMSSEDGSAVLVFSRS